MLGRFEEHMDKDDRTFRDRTFDDRTFTVVVTGAGLISIAVGVWAIFAF
jgi:hypothetical protein